VAFNLRNRHPQARRSIEKLCANLRDGEHSLYLEMFHSFDGFTTGPMFSIPCPFPSKLPHLSGRESFGLGRVLGQRCPGRTEGHVVDALR